MKLVRLLEEFLVDRYFGCETSALKTTKLPVSNSKHQPYNTEFKAIIFIDTIVFFSTNLGEMFSLGHKEENAHSESIYSCAWSQYKIEDEDEDDEMRSQVYQDFILTAGLDNVIKIWNVREDNTLNLKNQLNGHSLGVVSVDVSPDGRSEFLFKMFSVISEMFPSYCKQLFRFGPLFLGNGEWLVKTQDNARPCGSLDCSVFTL